MELGDTIDEAVSAAKAACDENPDSVAPAKPKRGSNASWPLIAYIAGMTVILIIVAVWQAVA